MDRKLKVFEACSGYEGWSSIWRENGHYVKTLDIDSYFNPDICIDILDYIPDENFDILFASPDCRFFSKIRNVWNNTSLRTTKEQKDKAILISQRCFDLIKELNVKYYLIENPIGGMSKYFSGAEIIDYCMYDFHSNSIRYFYNLIRKRTNIWTNIEFNKRLCDKSHEHVELCVALRNSKDRAKIPEELSKEIYEFIIKKENLI